MTTFAENLAQLETTDGLGSMTLYDELGNPVGEILNQPGSSGSFRVYYHLAVKWGGIGIKAAQEGLDLFAEHTADARANPGRHPNIDRLMAIIDQRSVVSVRCHNA